MVQCIVDVGTLKIWMATHYICLTPEPSACGRVWQYTAPLPSHSPAYQSQSDWRMQEKCISTTQANHSTPYCLPCEEIAAVHKWLTSKIRGNTCTPFSPWYSMRFNMYSVLLISVSCILQSDCPSFSYQAITQKVVRRLPKPSTHRWL